MPRGEDAIGDELKTRILETCSFSEEALVKILECIGNLSNIMIG